MGDHYESLEIASAVTTAIVGASLSGYDLSMSAPELVEKLVGLIRRRGYTQEQFERMTGLSKNRISKWVGGQGEPTARQLHRMAEALNVSLESFFVSDSSMTMGGSDIDHILWIVRQLGLNEARRRLLNERAIESVVNHGRQVGDEILNQNEWRGGRPG